MRSTRVLGVVALLVPTMIAAQQSAAPAAMSANPVTDATKGGSMRYGTWLKAAAQQVPADKLAFKLTDAQMTFGQIWAHLVEANYGICAAFGGTTPPAMTKLAGTESKEVLVKALDESFTYCDGVLAKTDDSNLGAQVDLGFMKTSKAQAMMIYVGDLIDHYSQVANYMRFNKMLPPSAQKKS
jgi:hypothetical protein